MDGSWSDEMGREMFLAFFLRHGLDATACVYGLDDG